eukprot:NODE_5852_length_632_cov_19.336192_g5455_i0.p1 GENE.NODE_5852_length_632_cov_19.336192_g5455_i0~~NODE_5852_length_632_cov_19.336192_g5455_i0.p1  ORF type:complete len:177 (-),score=38.74 NODE_5852_length_632_cov_19.336192_g5455_i0:74-604(-)
MGGATLSGSLAAKTSLGRILLDLEGVESLFVGHDYLTVTQTGFVDWPELDEKVTSALAEWKKNGGEQALEAEVPRQAEDSEVVAEIKELIEEKIQPMVQRDGGHVRFVAIHNGVVYVQLQGACESCSSSTITLKAGIERILMHWLPEITEVVGLDQGQADEYEAVFRAQGSLTGVV